MATEGTPGSTANATMASGKMEKCMEWDSFSGSPACSTIRDNTRMI